MSNSFGVPVLADEDGLSVRRDGARDVVPGQHEIVYRPNFISGRQIYDAVLSAE